MVDEQLDQLAIDQSQNGLVKDEEFEALMSEYEEKPLLIRTLTSKDVDDLKGMSEIPRRLIFALVNLDVVIEARDNLQELLFEQATKNYEDAIQLLEQSSTMLSDDDDENDTEAVRINRSAQFKLKRAKRKMRLALTYKGKGTLLKTFRLSYLQYMIGVERKGRTETIEAFTAIASVEEAEEIKAK